jgi:hypothetical protein
MFLEGEKCGYPLTFKMLPAIIALCSNKYPQAEAFHKTAFIFPLYVTMNPVQVGFPGLYILLISNLLFHLWQSSA